MNLNKKALNSDLIEKIRKTQDLPLKSEVLKFISPKKKDFLTVLTSNRTQVNFFRTHKTLKICRNKSCDDQIKDEINTYELHPEKKSEIVNKFKKKYLKSNFNLRKNLDKIREQSLSNCKFNKGYKGVKIVCSSLCGKKADDPNTLFGDSKILYKHKDLTIDNDFLMKNTFKKSGLLQKSKSDINNYFNEQIKDSKDSLSCEKGMKVINYLERVEEIARKTFNAKWVKSAEKEGSIFSNVNRNLIENDTERIFQENLAKLKSNQIAKNIEETKNDCEKLKKLIKIIKDKNLDFESISEGPKNNIKNIEKFKIINNLNKKIEKNSKREDYIFSTPSSNRSKQTFSNDDKKNRNLKIIKETYSPNIIEPKINRENKKNKTLVFNSRLQMPKVKITYNNQDYKKVQFKDKNSLLSTFYDTAYSPILRKYSRKPKNEEFLVFQDNNEKIRRYDSRTSILDKINPKRLAQIYEEIKHCKSIINQTHKFTKKEIQNQNQAKKLFFELYDKKMVDDVRYKKTPFEIFNKYISLKEIISDYRKDENSIRKYKLIFPQPPKEIRDIKEEKDNILENANVEFVSMLLNKKAEIVLD